MRCAMLCVKLGAHAYFLSCKYLNPTPWWLCMFCLEDPDNLLAHSTMSVPSLQGEGGTRQLCSCGAFRLAWLPA